MSAENLLLKPPKYKFTETASGFWKEFLYADGRLFREFTSYRKLFGQPLIHKVFGICPETGRQKTAKGFVAIGNRAKGVIALGQFANGYISIGQFSVGRIFSLGQFSVAPISIGQFSLGVAAMAQIGFAGFGVFQIGLTVFDGLGMTVLKLNDLWQLL